MKKGGKVTLYSIINPALKKRSMLNIQWPYGDDDWGCSTQIRKFEEFGYAILLETAANKDYFPIEY
jgi:hypothetical protein